MGVRLLLRWGALGDKYVIVECSSRDGNQKSGRTVVYLHSDAEELTEYTRLELREEVGFGFRAI